MSIVAQFFMIMGGVLTGYVGIGLAAAIGKLVGGGIFRFQFDEFIFFMVRLSKSGKHFSFGLRCSFHVPAFLYSVTKQTFLSNIVYKSVLFVNRKM